MVGDEMTDWHAQGHESWRILPDARLVVLAKHQYPTVGERIVYNYGYRWCFIPIRNGHQDFLDSLCDFDVTSERAPYPTREAAQSAAERYYARKALVDNNLKEE